MREKEKKREQNSRDTPFVLGVFSRRALANRLSARPRRDPDGNLSTWAWRELLELDARRRGLATAHEPRLDLRSVRATLAQDRGLSYRERVLNARESSNHL